MDKAYKNLIENNDDNFFSLEMMLVVRKILDFKSFNTKDQYKLELIKLILDSRYNEVEMLLKERKDALIKLYTGEMEK